MSARQKKKDELEMDFSEALTRFIQTDPKELIDHHEEVKKAQQETEDNAERIRERIKRGVRPAGKKFRL